MSYRLVKLYSNGQSKICAGLDGQDLIDRASKATQNLINDLEPDLILIVISKEPETSD